MNENNTQRNVVGLLGLAAVVGTILWVFSSSSKSRVDGVDPKKKIKAKFAYEDDWSRPVYKGDNGRYYVDVDGALHTMTSDGEPIAPVRDGYIERLDGLGDLNTAKTKSGRVKQRKAVFAKMEDAGTLYNKNRKGKRTKKAKA